MRPHSIALVMCLTSLIGCEGPHALITNMTQSPIKVTYSVDAIRENTVTLDPGKSAGYTGIGGVRADEVVVVQIDGVTRTYSGDTLERLRPHFRWGDCFGYFQDGLRSLEQCPEHR
jgi:hypothetical protein